MNAISTYRKGIVAVLGAVLVAIQVALTDNAGISQTEWITIALALVTAVGVYWIPNNTDAPEGDDGIPADGTTDNS